MVYRVFVEKKPALAHEANGLLTDLQTFLQIKGLTGLRLVNRYDVEGLDKALFDRCVSTVFSEPQLDNILCQLPQDADVCFAVEYLPGQFDQRADSAAQCIQLLSQQERPLVRSAKIYLLYGQLSQEDVAQIKHYVINPVEAREAGLEPYATLKAQYPAPQPVAQVAGFCQMDEDQLKALLADNGLAMDLDDLLLCQRHFQEEGRNPTITEIKIIDTYWSAHCRHTTFSTHLDRIDIQDEAVKRSYERYLAAREEVYGAEKAARRPKTLMDLATIGAKLLKKQGLLPDLDESEEINACSIHLPAQVNGENQDWLLMFKNETHNHPTEIEPFGGAATCIGGCIRDPLSGRAFVHQAMRFTGGGDPRKPLSETLPGKLPQRKLAQTAAAGYSSYGNQIGLATGHVAEVYHEGYLAKRLECGAVVAAAPADHVRRERPAPGDVVILLGGRTGRDGVGGATGSSKSHDLHSLEACGAEVQKGNAPEERKLQRLFRNGEVTRMIKRCNDFGAGGVSVAIGELADGLDIHLDAVRKKYEGLNGTELAISESQERMAVVVAAEDAAALIAAAQAENLEAYPVATVTKTPRVVLHWQGQKVADLSRAFLNTNGAEKHAQVSIPAINRQRSGDTGSLCKMASSLKCASRRGLVERFDSTIGAGSLLMPFGGKTQRTPAQAMAALLPVLPGQETDQGSVMAWGFDPEALSNNPYQGAYDAVALSLAKLTAAGADYRKAYLSLQEFFEKLRDEPARWGKPFAALLGALDAQLDFGAAAIGGKDSMSGTFLDHDVPPTLISFAVAPVKAGEILTPEFKEAGHPVYLFSEDGLDGNPENRKAAWEEFYDLHQRGKIKAAWAVGAGGMAEAVMNMSFGNQIGFHSLDKGGPAWYAARPGAILAELAEDFGNCHPKGLWTKIGHTTQQSVVAIGEDSASIAELLSLNESVLNDIYPTDAASEGDVPAFTYDKGCFAAPAVKSAKPQVLIPVFPGTNCEYDAARAMEAAGAQTQIVVINNLTAQGVAQSVEGFAKTLEQSQIIFLPGGFSGGDEPDGSAKFITAFFRNPAISQATMDLLNRRDGLMIGICNGFQALIKLGLVPYGKIIDTDENCPTLTYNVIGRHQSKLVRTRVCTNKSPWLAETQPGDIFTVPISHGEGRFLASQKLVEQLAENGQIATQYVDLKGNPTMDSAFNPNGSICAVEGITSPDGRIFGKMGHSERVGRHLYRNVPGNYEMGLFRSAVKYFK